MSNSEPRKLAVVADGDPHLDYGEICDLYVDVVVICVTEEDSVFGVVTFATQC